MYTELLIVINLEKWFLHSCVCLSVFFRVKWRIFQGKLWNAIFYLQKNKSNLCLKEVVQVLFRGLYIKSVAEAKVGQTERSSYFSLVLVNILSNVLPPTWMMQNIATKTSKKCSIWKFKWYWWILYGKLKPLNGYIGQVYIV